MSESVIVEKPWGHEKIWAKTPRYVGKILFIKAGHQLSLQFHRVKEETLLVQSGRMLLIFEPHSGAPLEEKVMLPGDVHHVSPLQKHRMRALEDTSVIEVSTPELEDVVRIEDSYGRAGQ